MFVCVFVVIIIVILVVGVVLSLQTLRMKHPHGCSIASDRMNEQATEKLTIMRSKKILGR